MSAAVGCSSNSGLVDS